MKLKDNEHLSFCKIRTIFAQVEFKSDETVEFQVSAEVFKELITDCSAGLSESKVQEYESSKSIVLVGEGEPDINITQNEDSGRTYQIISYTKEIK